MTARAPAAGPGEVVLRDVREDDLPTFFEHQRDPVASRMASFAPRDRDAFMAHWKGILGDPSVIVRTVLLDKRVAGNVVSFERAGLREVGYWIGRRYWGRGVGTRALAAFLGHDTSRPLHAHVAVDNVASLRVLERCGFTVVEGAAGMAGPGDDGVEEMLLVLPA